MAGKPRKISEDYAQFSTRDAILDAAERLCGELGVSGVKLREIARQVGIEPASVYSHFSGLDDVLFHVAKGAFDDLQNMYEGLDQKSAEDAVHQVNLELIRFLASNQGVARLFMNDFAAAQRLPAFSNNADRIESWTNRDVEMMRSKFELNADTDGALEDLFLGKLGLVGNLLASRWCFGNDVSEKDCQSFARMASTLVVSYCNALR